MRSANTPRIRHYPGHSSYYAASDIWTIAPDGSRPMQLTSEDADEYAPSWSPDGRFVAFTSRNPALGIPPRIYLTSAGGGGSASWRPFPAVSDVQDLPTWSRR